MAGTVTAKARVEIKSMDADSDSAALYSTDVNNVRFGNFGRFDVTIW